MTKQVFATGSNIFCPCKGCEDRDIYCHTSCEKYSIFREQARKRNEYERKERAKNHYASLIGPVNVKKFYRN